MIRLAKVEEAPIIYKLMLQAFEEYRRMEIPSSALNETLHDIDEALRSHSEQALIYELDENPVACCRFQLKEDCLYFFRLSVIPEARGKGVAKDILNWLEHHALDHYRAFISCRVRMSVPRNLDLYQSLDYVLIREDIITNSNGFDVKTGYMRKKIDSLESTHFV